MLIIVILTITMNLLINSDTLNNGYHNGFFYNNNIDNNSNHKFR